MTSRTPRRHRRLALMAAGTVAAMLVVPGTALAQEATPLDDNNPVVNTLEQLAKTVVGDSEAPAVVPGTDAVPDEAVPALPLDSDDDSEGHETEDPEFPDHGSGFVGNVDLDDSEILDLVRYDATVEDDGSTHSDSTVLALLGDEVVGSSSSSDGTTETSENPTEGICEALSGAVCLSLLYHDTISTVSEEGSLAGARGGVLSLCLLGDDENVTTTYECEGVLGAGAAEGEGSAERDGTTGHSSAYSDNELVKACLTEGWDGFTCEGILGLSVLHSDSESESVTPDTQRRSWLLGLDSGGEELLRIEDPTGISLPDGCGDNALLCLFLNQGESFIFENPQGAGSAQEALHLDLLNGTPLDILVELGQAESIAHLESPPGCEPGEKGPCPTDVPECKDGIDNDEDNKVDFPADPGCDSPEDDSEKDNPECKDGIDNDKDGKIDFPADPECDSPDDDSESDGKDGGLADTGADIAPLLAGAFLLIGMGALTVAGTRRRV
ncbi:MAG: hypothetical protein ACRDTC_00495, partial [Pseudonocardiaceae bacterium]